MADPNYVQSKQVITICHPIDPEQLSAYVVDATPPPGTPGLVVYGFSTGGAVQDTQDAADGLIGGSCPAYAIGLGYCNGGVWTQVTPSTPLPVTSAGGGVAANITEWNSISLGSPTAWGIAPLTGNVIGVNANILNSSIAVTGTVAVSSLPAITGTVTANAGTGTFNVAGAVTVSGTVAFSNTSIQVSNFPASQIVSFNSIAQPVTLASLPLGAVNLTELNSVGLGSPSAYGTSPGSINVQGVNAYVTNTVAVSLSALPLGAVNLTEVAGAALGLTAVVAYGSTPAAALVPAVNAFQTNVVSAASIAAAIVANPGTQPVSGTVTALQGTSPWVVGGTVTANAGTGTFAVGGTVAVSNFPTSTTITGTVAVTQSTSPWVVSGAVTVTGTVAFSNTTIAVTNTGTFAVQAAQSGAWTVAVNNFPATQAVSGTVTALQGTSPWVVSGTVAVSGSVAVTGTFWQATQPVSIASTVNVDVTNTVPVTGTFWQATQPVSGTVAVSNFPATVAVTQSTSPWVVSGTVAFSNTTIAVTQSTSPWVISGAITLASTTVTNTVTVAGNLTNNSAAPIADNLGVLGFIAESAYANLTYTSGDQVLAVTDIHGAINHDLQAVAGAAVVTAAAGVQEVGIVGHAGASLDSAITAATAPANALAVSDTFNTTAPTLTTGQSVGIQGDVRGSLLVSTEGRKSTFRVPFSNAQLASATFPGVVFYGSTSKLTKVTKLRFQLTTATQAYVAMTVASQSAAWTGGTSYLYNTFSMDTSGPAPTSAIYLYGALATGGGGTQIQLNVIPFVTMATTTILSSANAVYEEVLGDGVGRQPYLLRSGYNMAFFFSAGCTLSGFVEWTEE